jgi:hypothetical protein
LTPIVAAKREPSPEERTAEFLRREFAAMRTGPRKTKRALRDAARKEIAGVSLRMFDQMWDAEAPAESRKPGAPRKAHRSG